MMIGLLFNCIDIDVYNLPIGKPGHIELRVNLVLNTRDGNSATLKDIVDAARGKRFVFVGESHDNPDAHRWQADIIEALSDAGRSVIVGMEMYTRPKQHFMNLWTLGKLSEEDFIERSDWKGQWGFDYALYRPIFDVVNSRRLRLVGLNIPRDWVRAVGRGGYDALPDDAKKELPSLYMDNKEHRLVFDALMGGHPIASPNVYAAQVLWDEGMADTAIKYLMKTSVTDNTVFVVIAGNGHTMYGQGINYRIKRRTGLDGVTVATVDIPKDKQSLKVARGIGDFVIGVTSTQQ
ncbi:MAG: ChaN family lipoprotein [Fimbriimonadales bacterium]